jgi:hypothetical protein
MTEDIDYEDQFFQAFLAGVDKTTNLSFHDRDVWALYLEWLSEQDA